MLKSLILVSAAILMVACASTETTAYDQQFCTATKKENGVERCTAWEIKPTKLQEYRYNNRILVR